MYADMMKNARTSVFHYVLIPVPEPRDPAVVDLAHVCWLYGGCTLAIRVGQHILWYYWYNM